MKERVLSLLLWWRGCRRIASDPIVCGCPPLDQRVIPRHGCAVWSLQSEIRWQTIGDASHSGKSPSEVIRGLVQGMRMAFYWSRGTPMESLETLFLVYLLALGALGWLYWMVNEFS